MGLITMEGAAFCDCAQRLLAVPTADEADLRSVVSRAYYGAYHHCKRFMIDVLKIRPPEGGSSLHNKLPFALANTSHPVIVAIGHKLETHRRNRNDSDYDLLKRSAGTRPNAACVVREIQTLRYQIDQFNEPPEKLSQMQKSVEAHFQLNLIGWSIITRL
jgi:hypothetical protein